MGYHNVRKVFMNWTHLDHREIRALVFMANESRDDEAPPRYWGGWEHLARALGANVAKPASARRTAVRTLGALAKAGAIVSSGQARAGVRAEYALALDENQTFEPTGQGRHIQWQAIERPKGITRPGQDQSMPQAMASSMPKAMPSLSPHGGLTESSPETATGTQPETAGVTQGETAGVTQGETATGTQPETATGSKVRQLEVPLVKRSLNTDLEGHLEVDEEAASSVSQVKSAHARKNAAAQISPFDDEQEHLTEEQERQRQMKALQDRMKAEHH